MSNQLREARIIAPLSGNSGEYLGAAHFDLCQSLLDTFQGYTQTEARGGWRNLGTTIVEPVICYDVACVDTDGARVALRNIAEIFKRQAKQECVYVRFPTGDVELVS